MPGCGVNGTKSAGNRRGATPPQEPSGEDQRWSLFEARLPPPRSGRHPPRVRVEFVLEDHEASCSVPGDSPRGVLRAKALRYFVSWRQCQSDLNRKVESALILQTDYKWPGVPHIILDGGQPSCGEEPARGFSGEGCAAAKQERAPLGMCPYLIPQSRPPDSLLRRPPFLAGGKSVRRVASPGRGGSPKVPARRRTSTLAPMPHPPMPATTAPVPRKGRAPRRPPS